MSLLDNTQLALEAAMNGSMLRQTLLTGDLVNANTPGFQPRDVNFQQTLSQALSQGQSPQTVSFTPYTQRQTNGPNGNGVDTELTNAEIAENSLLYDDLTKVASARESILEAAMNASQVP